MVDVEGVVVGIIKEDVDASTTIANNSNHLHNNTTTIDRRLFATNVAHLATLLLNAEHQSIWLIFTKLTARHPTCLFWRMRLIHMRIQPWSLWELVQVAQGVMFMAEEGDRNTSWSTAPQPTLS